MTPDMIDAMIDAGLTREQMAALIKHELSKQEAAKEAKRFADAARQRKSRASRMSRDVTVTECDSLPPSPDGPLSLPQTPTQTPLNPPSCPASAGAAEQASSRQAQHEAGQGKIDYEEVQRWVSGLVGSNPVALNFDISPIITLIRAGYSRERIEIGVKAAVAAAKQPIRSWKSFDGWVKNTAADAAPIAKPIDRETEWRNKLDHWRKRNDWPGVWGDPPGHPCCKIPEAFIASHVNNWSREAAE